MLATIIVLSILVVLLITYVILVSLQKKKDTDKAYKKGADDLFSAILANGWKKKVNDFNEYNKCVNKGGIIFVGDSLTDNYNVYEYYKGYAIGDTKEGPFTSPRIIYVTKEPEEINKGTTYTYNAKSHLHLSSPRNILVSYNVNDMSMKQSKLNRTIYHPRFLNFIDTSND